MIRHRIRLASGEAVEWLADVLEIHVEQYNLHGNFDAITWDDETSPLYEQLEYTENWRQPPCKIALAFIDAWWGVVWRDHHYDGILKDEWPQLATDLAQQLRTRTPLTDPRVLKHFGPRPPWRPWQRLKGWLFRGATST